MEIPDRFHAAYSTLTLHHCLDIENVFRSLIEVLEARGKAVIVDLCEHSFEEFQRELGNTHLGFRLEEFEEKASKYFPRVQTKKMSGIRCEQSGRSAELFIAYMTT